MFPILWLADTDGVDVQVTFVRRDPPAGVISSDGRTSSFAGWLGLLAVLERPLSLPDDMGYGEPGADVD